MTANTFKQAIASGRVQFGLWQSLASALPAEVCASTGFDWLLFDGEHAPNTLQTLLGQLHAVAGYPIEPIARVPVGRAEIIKQYLDLGFRSLLVPMVNDPDQAREIVRATRFPPVGVRGVASGTVRASGFGADANYLQHTHEELCLILQIETAEALANIEEIAAIEGVDALFIGPSDLAASLGHLGNVGHPEVQAAIGDGLGRIVAAGKPAGIFAGGVEDARDKIAAGASFVSLGTDIGVLAAGCRQLLSSIR